MKNLINLKQRDRAKIFVFTLLVGTVLNSSVHATSINSNETKGTAWTSSNEIPNNADQVLDTPTNSVWEVVNERSSDDHKSKEQAKILELRQKLETLYEKQKDMSGRLVEKNSKLEELRKKISFLYDKQKELYSKLDEKNQRLVDLREKIAILREKAEKFRVSSVTLKKSEPIAYSKLKGRFAKNWLGPKNETLGFIVEEDRVILGADTLFYSGSSSIRESAIPQLKAVGRKLANMAKNLPSDLDWNFAFEGHADKVPIKSGKYKTNLELSLARAIAVHRVVTAYTALPEDKISIASFGSSRPRTNDQSANGLAENRRVEIRLISR